MGEDIVEIHTDGGCRGNPGPGGWAAVLKYQGKKKEIVGTEAHTTNNRMELMAVIGALERLKEPCRVTVVTDSQYIANAFRERWVDRWQKNGWRTTEKKPVKNEDLWRRLLDVAGKHEVEWNWVRGHNEHPENERADRLAVAARDAAAGRPA